MTVVATKPEPPSFTRFVTVAATMGLLGFGGGWVVLGWIRRAFVDERRWISESEFIEYASVASVLPGTTAPNLLTLLGHRLGGPRWAAVAPAVFVLPSAVLVAAIAAFYDQLRGMDFVMRLFDGMGAAVAGVIVAVAISMRRRAVTTLFSGAIALVAFALVLARMAGLLEVFVAAGVLGAATMRPKGGPPTGDATALFALAPAVAVVVPAATVLGIFWLFARIGSATFGGGYSMIAAMHDDLVGRGWVDDKTFSDAIAVGQITPGPVALAGTFIGYRVGGLAGAVAATAGMFLPPLAITLAVARSLASFRSSAAVKGALAGVGAAVVGVIAASAWSVGQASVHDMPALVVALLACALMVARPKLSPLWPLFGGALALYAYRKLAR